MKKISLIVIALILVLVAAAVLYINPANFGKMTDNAAKPTLATQQVMTLTVLATDNASYQVPFLAGTKLLPVLQDYSKTNSKFSLGTEANAYGDFVATVNGLKADASKEYWNIKVNGVDSMVGISDITPQVNDTITFSLVRF